RLEREIRRHERQAKARTAALYIDSIRAIVNAGGTAAERLASEFERSKRAVGQRLDSRFITEQLEEELQNRNIPLDFDLSINKGRTDSVLYQFAKYTADWDRGSHYSAVLFPYEISDDEAVVSVYFPNKTSILMGNAK